MRQRLSPRSRVRWAPVFASVVLACVLLVTVQAPVGAAAPGALPVGFYPGDGVAAVQRQELEATEAWLGRRADDVVLMTDVRSPSAFDASVAEEFSDPAGWTTDTTHHLVVSVPLAFGGFNPTAEQARDGLKATASGRYDASFRKLADDLVSSGHANATLRLGWEYDGNWMPWSAFGSPAAFVQAYRHVHDVFHGVSSKFQYDLCGSQGNEYPGSVAGWHGFTDWTVTYPGDDVVNSIGLDVYDQGLRVPYDLGARTWLDPSDAWQVIQRSLDAQLSFAEAHKKPVSYPEWALSGGGTELMLDHGGDNTAFIAGMAHWLRTLPSAGPGSLAFMAYFNANPATDGPHALTSFPRGASAFREAFGAGAVATSPAHPGSTPGTPRLAWILAVAAAVVAIALLAMRRLRSPARKRMHAVPERRSSGSPYNESGSP